MPLKRIMRPKHPTPLDSFDTSGGPLPGPLEDSSSKVPPDAIVVRTLADFSKVDKSQVYPRGAAKSIDLITQTAPGTFRFLLRHRGKWYDGDRTLEWNYKGHDKSRAEAAPAGPKVKTGETWDFSTTVRLAPDFVPSEGYCNIAQPVFSVGFFTLTEQVGDTTTGEYFFNPDPKKIGQGAKLARSVTFKRGQWTTFVWRIHFDKKGSIKMSMNGDAFVGLSGVDTSRATLPVYKMGLYGTGVKDIHGKKLGDQVVEHKNVYMRRI
jgi:hypothetical protein